MELRFCQYTRSVEAVFAPYVVLPYALLIIAALIAITGMGFFFNDTLWRRYLIKKRFMAISILDIFVPGRAVNFVFFAWGYLNLLVFFLLAHFHLFSSVCGTIGE